MVLAIVVTASPWYSM